MKDKPLLHEPYIIALFLFFFWPVGLYLLWKHGELSKKTKLLISSFVLFIALLFALLFFSFFGLIFFTLNSFSDTDPFLPENELTLEQIYNNPEGFRQDIIEGCVAQGTPEFGCACIYDYYIENFTLENFLSDSREWVNNPDLPPSERMITASSVCNEQYNSPINKPNQVGE